MFRNTEQFRQTVPYLESYLAASFSDTVQWWAAQKMEIPPETVAGYFLTVIENGIIHR